MPMNGHEKHLPPAKPGGRGWPSVRGRITAWTAGVFTVALLVFAAVGILGERRRIRELEAAHAEGLLAHLAGMPELQGDPETATARLALLLPSLRSAGGEVRLVGLPPDGAMAARCPLALWPLSLGGRAFELRYYSDGKRMRELTTHSLVVHLLYGVLALGALVGGLWWILTRSLVEPLRAIASVIDRITSGGGWLSVVPQTDAELCPLARSVLELGPGLESQVNEWIVAERRAGVAVALSSLHSVVEPPLERMRRTLEGTLPAAGDAWRARSPLLLAELDLVEEALAREERRLFRSEGLDARNVARARLSAADVSEI